MEDDQQFCLRWNNHQSTLIQNFDTLLESGTLVDCTLAAEGKYLKAHKVVLSACSPYFEGLLSEHYDKHPVFILKDVKFKELKAMMDYMYRGEVNISQDQLAALLKAAESLQIKGLSDSKTGGSKTTDTRQTKVSQAASQPPLDIPQTSSHLTIEKNKVPRQSSAGDLPEDSASPQISKGLSSREGSVSPTSRKRKRLRRRSLAEDNSVENHETSNSSDMPQQMGGPALGIAPVADEKSHADAADSLGRSALMTQLTKPADEMLQLPLEKPEPNDSLIEPKSEYLEDQEESVEDLTLDDDMNDLNEMDQDTNRAGPSHDPSQHPAGLSWHVTGDRSNTGGVVGSVAAPGATDEVFLAAQEAAHRDSQETWLDGFSISYSQYKTLSAEDIRNQRALHSRHQPQDDNPSSEDNGLTSVSFLCSTETSTSSSMKAEKEEDVYVKKFKCHMCGKAYGYYKSLMSHIKFHCRIADAKTIFTCPICHNKFTRKCGFASHMKNVHGNRHKMMRGKEASRDPRDPRKKLLLNKKMTMMTESHKCRHCKRAYLSREMLLRHIRNECGANKQFNCPICGRGFSRQPNVLRHIKETHEHAQLIQCSLCGSEFKRKESLLYHLRKQHADVLVPK